MTWRIGPARKSTSIPTAREKTLPEIIAVLTCLFSFPYSPAPNRVPIRMPDPRLIPCTNMMISVMIGLLVPTAASAVLPTNFPTIMLSTALYVS